VHFNAKGETESDKSSLSSFDSNRLIILDSVIIDDQSRLTFTKRLKKNLPISPKDNIIFYQDIYNKNIVLKVQRGNDIVYTWIVKEDHKIPTKRKELQKVTRLDLHQYKISPTYYNTNILLIDDDEDVLKVFKCFLTSEGYNNVQTYSDSRKAMRFLIGLEVPYRYALAIIDIRMPNINGIQFYQMLKILCPYVRIMFATALDAVDELISMYPQINSEDILRKPVDQDCFMKKVNDMILEIYANT
jgi:CheY-like chemotaxis protein